MKLGVLVGVSMRSLMACGQPIIAVVPKESEIADVTWKAQRDIVEDLGTLRAYGLWFSASRKMFLPVRRWRATAGPTWRVT